MDLITGRVEPNSVSPLPLSHPGDTVRENSPLRESGERTQSSDWDVPNDSAESHDSTSATSSSAIQEPESNSGNCDEMIEKWRLIKVADKTRAAEAHKKIYPTYDAHKTLFGRNYSKFYEAFQQGLDDPQPRRPVSTTGPVKRSLDAAPERASKRQRQHERASLPQLDQHRTPTFSAPRLAATVAKSAVGAKPSHIVSLRLTRDEESSATPRPRSDSAAKEQPSRRKGVGLYAGNWEYVTDEEKVPEYLRVAEKIADVEGRTTRRAYANLTSKDGARASDKLIRSSFDNRVRKSGRARHPVDYARLSTSEDNVLEVATAERTNPNSTPRKAKQTSPSNTASSTSERSTLMPDDQSRSTSTSTPVNTEQAERPKRSWNAIVYEVLAMADAPLTFTQLTQEIKSRYPFFKASSQEKVLKSGLKNPLYFHEAFCKGEIIDGKQTWGLKPGQFVDKKTGEVLTPPPRNPIMSGPSEQAPEIEHPSPAESTHIVSQPQRPRSSNPRFGREILNSPEIPDSPDVVPATPSPKGSVSRIVADRSQSSEEPPRGQELADAANGYVAAASPEIQVSVLETQPHSQLAVLTTEELQNIASTHKSSAVTGFEDQSVRTTGDPSDHGSSVNAVLSASVSQSTQPRAPVAPSSLGGGEDYSKFPRSQIVSKPAALANLVSPTYVSTVPREGAAISQLSYLISVTPTNSANPLPCTQLDDSDTFSPNGKAGAKENTYVHME